MDSLQLRVVRGIFAIAEHVAPRLAGRVAFELFCRTPHPKRLSLKAREIVAAAEPFMMEARQHLLTSAYGSFNCYEFRPRLGGGWASTALVLHGWGSRSEHMRPLIEALLDRGQRVLALDFPGHGTSPGRRLNMAMAVAAVKTVEQWFAPISAVIGHSFGGAAAVNALAGSVRGVAPVLTRRLVLIAAPDEMRPIFVDFARRVALGKRTSEAFFGQVERVTGRPLADFSGAKQVVELSIPVLVLHAPDDREVFAANADAYERAGPHVEKLWIAGAGHRRILAHPVAVEAASAFASGGPLRLVDRQPAALAS